MFRRKTEVTKGKQVGAEENFKRQSLKGVPKEMEDSFLRALVGLGRRGSEEHSTLRRMKKK